MTKSIISREFLLRVIIVLEPDGNLLVSKIMKSMPLITALPGISRKEAERILEENRIEKLPIVDKNGLLRGLITAKDILKEKEFPNAVKDTKGRLAVGVALRLNSDYLDEAKKLVAVGADVLLLDTARRFNDDGRGGQGKLKKLFQK